MPATLPTFDGDIPAVGCIGSELLHLEQLTFDAGQHVVQGTGLPAQFVSAARPGRPLREEHWT